MTKSSYSDLLEEFGVPNSTIWCTLNLISPPLKLNSLKHLWDIIRVGKTTKKIVIEVIAKKVIKNKSGPKNYPLKDEEAYIVETSEIDGAHGLKIDIVIPNNEKQQGINGVSKISMGNGTQPKSAQRYACRIIQLVNIEDDEEEVNKRITRKSMIKVSRLSHKRAKKSDPRLAWFMFHKIYHMYSNIKNKEVRNAAMLITSMSEQ